MKLLSDYHESVRSTIDIDRLRALPTYTPPSHIRVDAHMGSVCSGDAPGYPSYFLRAVWTKAGDHPLLGPYYVILYEDQYYVIETAGSKIDTRDALLKTFYKPLPWGHPRVEAWVNELFLHFNHCYRDVEHPEYGRPGILIYPVPYYKLTRSVPDPDPEKYTAQYIEKHFKPLQEKARVENAKIQAEAERIATFDNHLAVVYVREIYPDAQIEEMRRRLDHPPTDRGGWYARELVRPTPQTCQGDPSLSNYPHRNDRWCQYCGYSPEES